jgi:hypothetical protein
MLTNKKKDNFEISELEVWEVTKVQDHHFDKRNKAEVDSIIYEKKI